MIYLVAPDPASFTSGGNRFNQKLLDGLYYLGYPVNRIEFGELNDSILDKGNIIIFDSLFLNRFSVNELNKIKAKKIFLIHLLPSMIDRQADLSHEKRILACFDLIIANSDFTRDYCLRLLCIENPIVIIQPFIEKKQRDRKVIFPNKFIHVSNWVPEKQIDLFLHELTKQTLPANLSIYFYGDFHRDEKYFNQCSSILDRYPYLIKHIHLEGPLPYTLLQGEYADAALLIDTSSMETYGMAVAEAIAHGVPVISLGNGNTKNLVNKNNGLVCRSMEEVVVSILRYYQGNLRFDKMDASTIVMDWIQFCDQLKQIIRE